MKNVLFTLFILLFCNLVFAEKNYEMNLRKALAESKQDTNRLYILYQLSQVSSYNPQERTSYINQLLQEAERQENNKYKCKAYLTHIVVAYNSGDIKEVQKWQAILEPLAKKEKLYDLYFEGKHMAIDILSQKQEYELGEKEAQSMLEEAKQLDNATGIVTAYHSLARCYMVTYRGAEALQTLEKAISLATKYDKPILKDELLGSVLTICEQQKIYEKWIKYLRMRNSNIQKLSERFPYESFNGSQMMNYISFLKYYTSLRLWDAARKYLNLVEQSYAKCPYRTETDTYYYLTCKHYYYFQRKEWAKALEEIEKTLPIVQEISQVTYVSKLAQKTQLLTLLGRHQEASDNYKHIKKLKDSLEISTIAKQAEQLKDSYNTNIFLLEKESRRNQNQQTFLALAGIVIVILILFICHANKVKRQLVKAEQEMKQMMEETEQSNMTKERFLSNINMSIRPLLETIVRNSTLLASEHELSPTEKTDLSTLISKTSDQLMELIDEILLLSKLEAGIMRFTMKDIDICQLIREATASSDIQICPATNTDCTIRGDQAYLKQIMDSIAKSPAGDKKNISITIEKKEEAKIDIIIKNTPLATNQPSQEVIVRNEINRMLATAFDGKYQVNTTPGDSYVSLTFQQNGTRR